MLGYFVPTGRGEGDRLLAAVAEDLAIRGVAVAGAVQHNVDYDPDRRCHMDLSVIGQDGRVRISQERGKLASGCRLDAQGLVEAVQRVEAALAGQSVGLVIVNKFGVQECEGGGFREVIGRALTAGIPVLTSVSSGHLSAFLAFADGLAEEIPPTHAAVVDWCLKTKAR